jgi:hypothetical protein
MWIMPFQRITLTGFHDIWDDYDIAFMIIVTIKQGRLKCMNKKNELYDVPFYKMKNLKFGSSWHWIEDIC